MSDAFSLLNTYSAGLEIAFNKAMANLMNQLEERDKMFLQKLKELDANDVVLIAKVDAIVEAFQLVPQLIASNNAKDAQIRELVAGNEEAEQVTDNLVADHAALLAKLEAAIAIVNAPAPAPAPAPAENPVEPSEPTSENTDTPV